MGETVEAMRAMEQADDAFARFDVDAYIAHLSAAVRGFTDAGDTKQAAVACARLGDAMSTMLGNRPAARAWYARATRLLADEPPCVEQGWVAVAGMGCEVDDPAELLAAAELALDRARRFGDAELETKALADGGLALGSRCVDTSGRRRPRELIAQRFVSSGGTSGSSGAPPVPSGSSASPPSV